MKSFITNNSTRKFAILIAIFGTFGISWMVFKPEPQPSNDLFEMKKNLDIFYDVYSKVEGLYVDEPQPGALMKTGIDAMLRSLDPYTVYIPESKIEDYNLQNTGIYGGIGAIISTHDGKITVVESTFDQPAYNAGLRVGDIITSVDGKSVSGKTHSDINELIKGQPGTEITMTVKHPGDSSESKLVITREHIEVSSISHKQMIDDKTGYIKLEAFTFNSYEQFRTAYVELEDQGMTQFVFDLRGNGGGLVDAAVKMVNMFVAKGEDIVVMKGRTEDANKTYQTRERPINTEIPIAVLVDENSASASEIVCGSLQDLDRAVIVGTRTYGKGLVQQTHPIKYNSIVKLTVAKYYMPSGRCVQKIDYFHKQDGKANEIPDSLISPFKTRNGRKVFDGSGVDPDIKISPEEITSLVEALVSNKIVFDYATRFYIKHDSIAGPDKFKLSESDFQEFKKFALSKKFDYVSESLLELHKLQEVASNEKYNQSGVKNALRELENQFTSDVASDIDRYKDQIIMILENEIISRYYHQSGRMKYALKNDNFLHEAIKVINNRSQYNKVLGSL